MRKNLKVGVVGATGLVGTTFLRLLEERQFPLSELRLFASENSAGKTLTVSGKNYPVQALSETGFAGLDLVFFSSGDDISKQWAPIAAAEGAYAVDNSAAFRMDPNYILCVPEVNGSLVSSLKSPTIIANPNCSTIQLVVALKPLATAFGLSGVRVSSYQAVSGAGLPAKEELLEQVANFKNNPTPVPSAFTKPIVYNCIPQIGSFNEQGYSSEEMKIINESKKILGLPELKVSAFTIRVPVLNAHSETVWVTLQKQTTRDEILKTLEKAPGLTVVDNPKANQYPTPLEVSGKDEIFVGRIHQDIDDPKTWLMWIVGDNLKKGAALNGIQIAEMLFQI